MSNLKCVFIHRLYFRFKVLPPLYADVCYANYRLVHQYACCSSVLKNSVHYSPTSNISRPLQSLGVKFYCTASDKKNELFTKHRDRVKKEFQSYIEQNKERFRDTEQKIKHTSSVLLKDIKETKDKVKEKVEGIVEVHIYSIRHSYIVYKTSNYFRGKTFTQFQTFCAFLGYFCLRTLEC